MRMGKEGRRMGGGDRDREGTSRDQVRVRVREGRAAARAGPPDSQASTGRQSARPRAGSM